MPNKSIVSFQQINDDQSARYLANHYPTGKLTGKRFNITSVIYKFILCIATFIKVTIGDIYILAKNRDLDQAEELLERWETSVKIPLEIPRLETLEERRAAVKCLISKKPVYNINNGIVDECTTFEHYILCLTGMIVTIKTAQVEGSGSVFPMEFAVNFGLGGAAGSFLFIIEVPVVGAAPNNFFSMPFPVQFFEPSVPSATIELLDKILDRVIPSFCRWVYEAVLI